VSTHRDFCTLFDACYLLKALALYDSLERHSTTAFRLWMLCIDDEAFELVTKLDLPHATPVALGDFLDPELEAIQPTRSRGEFCWTLTPSLPLYLLDTQPRIEIITYLDADLLFFDDPQLIFDELGDASIGIVEHRYSAGLAAMAQSHGIYNVECMVFRRDPTGLEALRWWRERCNEWCYNRAEDGKFGDQKYLDDWPSRFESVRVLKGKGVGLAPWNIENYHIAVEDSRVTVDGEPLVFYHFHQFQLLDGGKAYRATDGGFNILPFELRALYEPYAAAQREALARLRQVAPDFDRGIEQRTMGAWFSDATASLKARVRATLRMPR